MKRILTGIQPSGKLHIGNYFGMIAQVLEYQRKSDYEVYLFIADLHALTTSKEHEVLRDDIINLFLDLMALGIDRKKYNTKLWVQSMVPAVMDLAWFISTVTPKGLLNRAHGYKQKVANGLDPSVGLYFYPILMAADILIFKSDLVPVGRDQKQHLEIAQQIARKFNRIHGKQIFKIPRGVIKKNVGVIRGTDGRKMSKSYGNTINIFDDEKKLHKSIMSIKTDSKAVDAPKNPDKCNILRLYKLVADRDPAIAKKKLRKIRMLYRTGQIGYGESKQILYEAFISYFKNERSKRKKLAAQLADSAAEKARIKFICDLIQDFKEVEIEAHKVLNEINDKIGLSFWRPYFKRVKGLSDQFLYLLKKFSIEEKQTKLYESIEREFTSLNSK